MNNPNTMTDELASFDVDKVRAEFPVLNQMVKDKPLVYLDNAATSQKPLSVIEALDDYYHEYNSNIHRGVHYLSQVATDAYESSRKKIRKFIHAESTKEIIFVRGATEGINLVAQTFGKNEIAAGDEILITEMEHHSNIVPWQMLAEQTNATLKYIPINDAGELQLELLDELITEKTKLVALVHISNALGTINPIELIIERAHAVGAKVLIDGAQAVPHTRVNVTELDCDFYVLSGHKLFGPTGIGVLYGKQSLLETLPPYQGGGDMIKMVSMSKTLYNDLPYKFEAGTPHIAGAIGLGAAIDYIESIDFDSAIRHEHELINYANELAEKTEGMNLVGTAKDKTSILSFTLDGIHPHDIGTIVDNEGIAIRAGHHCAMPIMERFRIPATARASFAFYNTFSEVDALFASIDKCYEVFG
ncbi:MAG: cysteine desulfurase [Pseudomonadota bacterium]